MLKSALRKLLPESVRAFIRERRAKRFNQWRQTLPRLTEEALRAILVERLGVKTGDVLFVHSSIDRLNLAFPFYGVLSILRDLVGEEGTLLFPVYPKLPSYGFLQSGEVFDVRKSPSYTGILTEFARRQRGAVRSLHPAKSVVAIGRRAEELTAHHHESPYPYDAVSPYYAITKYGGKMIGVGVGTYNLSFVHCADDVLKNDFPVKPYHDELFQARCINREGVEVIVPTYAHDMRRMNHDIPRYMKEHVALAICEDVTIEGMDFFRGDAVPLLGTMVQLARRGITIYPRSSYKKSRP